MTLGEKIDSFIDRMRIESQETKKQRLKKLGIDEFLEKCLIDQKDNKKLVHLFEDKEGKAYIVKIIFEEQ